MSKYVPKATDGNPRATYSSIMKNPGDPAMIRVDKTDEVAVVEFEGKPKPAIYPAVMLHAEKDMAEFMSGKRSAESANLQELEVANVDGNQTS